ncbi:MAG: hypothetical protein AAB365_01450 [Patescibacteria group bacterium]
MLSDKSLTVIIVACLAAVGIAAGIKINQSSQVVISSPLVFVPRHVTTEPDPSFFAPATNVEPVVGVAIVDPLKIPGVTARAYLIGDTVTGNIFTDYNSQKVLPVASMSKLVTAFVTTDIVSASSTIEITPAALLAPPDRSGLMEGERFTRSEILYPLLLSSSNIAAEALSSSTEDRPEFLELMSSYSWEIGMPNSFFADPSGVSPQNAATARDIFALAGYLVNYRPDILAITRVPIMEVATTSEHGSHIFQSTHPFVTDPRFIGGKTGRTPEAGETMVTIMNIGGKKVAVVVLGSQNRESDTRILLRKAEAMLSAQ